MNTDAIVAKILEEAREQSSALLREANDRARALRKEAEDKLSLTAEKARKDAKAQSEEMRLRMLRMAELDQKKALLGVKREVMDETFNEVLRLLKNMDSQKKRDFNLRILLDNSEGGEELIISSDEESVWSGDFVQAVNDELKKSGRKPVRLAGKRDLSGGFVLKNGGMEINCTYQASINDIRPRIESEVARMLFKDN